jgi:hypothetical protein
MRSYIETNKDFTVKHPPTVFVSTSKGNMLQCKLHLKMIANNRDRLEMAGLLLPTVFEEGAEQVLIDAQTGELYGATAGCRRKFGIPSELCYGSEKRTGVLNIKQIFPKSSTVQEIKETAETQALMTLDTTLIPAIFQLDRNESSSQDLNPFGATANYKQHSVRVRVNQIELEPKNEEPIHMLCLEIWKDKSYLQGYAMNLHTLNQPVGGLNYLTVSGTANLEPSSMSNQGTSQLQSMGSGVNNPSEREAIMEVPMEKEESESEIQRLIAYQDRIRKLREKRSQINSDSTTLKVTSFSFGPMMLSVLMVIYFITSFSLSSTIKNLLEGSVQSQFVLAELIAVLPTIATLANRASLISSDIIPDTILYNKTSLPRMIKYKEESLKQKEIDLKTEILKMVSLGSDWQLERGQFYQNFKTNSEYNTLVTMDFTDATYQLVLSCENIFEMMKGNAAILDDEMKRAAYLYIYKNYASSFRRYFIYLQGEFTSFYSQLLKKQGEQILFVFIGTFVLFLLIFMGMIVILFRISEEMMSVPKLISELKLTDIASALSNLRHYEGDLIKQKVVGNSLYKLSSEINPEDLEIESQNFTKTGVFSKRRSLKNNTKKDKSDAKREIKQRSKSIKKQEQVMEAKRRIAEPTMNLRGLLLVAQVPKIFRNSIRNRANSPFAGNNIIKINPPNHPVAVKAIGKPTEPLSTPYKRRFSISKVKHPGAKNKPTQDRASIMLNKSYHRAITNFERRKSIQKRNDSIGSKFNSDDESLKNEQGKLEEPRVNQKELKQDSIFKFVRRWQLSLALISMPFAILTFLELYQSLSTVDVFQSEITLLSNIRVSSNYITSFVFQNTTNGVQFTDGIGRRVL